MPRPNDLVATIEFLAPKGVEIEFAVFGHLRQVPACAGRNLARNSALLATGSCSPRTAAANLAAPARSGSPRMAARNSSRLGDSAYFEFCMRNLCVWMEDLSCVTQ